MAFAVSSSQSGASSRRSSRDTVNESNSTLSG
jgi:hypothetical protein